MRRHTAHATPKAIAAAILVAAALCLLAAMPAEAAKPPANRTYYTVFTGLEEDFDLLEECLVFTETEVCDLDGEVCGAWWMTEAKAGEMGIAFELSFSDDGVLTRINGHGRVDSLGRASSLGGAGHVEAEGVESNFAFAARQTGPNGCAALLAEEPPPPPPLPGPVVTESRQVRDFDEVALHGVGRLYIEHGNRESLTITAESHILRLLTSEVRNGRLVLAPGPNTNIRTRYDIVYRLTVKSLDTLFVSGAGWIEALDIDTERLDVEISGAGAIIAGGRAGAQHVDVSGAGAYLAGDLESRDATINVSGAAYALLRVSRSLRGWVSGVAVLEYIGNPSVDVTASGLSVVRRVGD